MNLFELDSPRKFKLDGKKIKYFYYIEFGEINEVAIYEKSVARMNEFYYLMYCGVCIKKGKKEDIFKYYYEIMNNKERLKFVHLSRDLRVNGRFEPRVPISRLDTESSTIKRVSVARNLSDAYSGMHGYSMEKYDEWGYNQFIMYEIIPDELGIELENIILNEVVSKHVPDAKHTGEFWITQDFEVPLEKISGVRMYEFEYTSKHYEDVKSNMKWTVDCFNITDFKTFSLREFYSKILEDYKKIICDNKDDIKRMYGILSELFKDYIFAKNLSIEKIETFSEQQLKEEIVLSQNLLFALSYVYAEKEVKIIDMRSYSKNKEAI